MVLPASGPISFNAINVELGVSGTNPNSSINSPTYRTLAGVPAGQISLSNFYGKSPAPPGPVMEYAIMSGGGGRFRRR